MARVNNIENWLKTGSDARVPVKPEETGPKPDIEAPLETEQPPVETAPETETPPVETPPAETPPPEKKDGENQAWRQIHALKKQVRELTEAVQRNGGKPAEVTTDTTLPDINEKPVENLDTRVRTLTDHVLRLEQANNALMAQNQQAMQEQNYRAQHSEYDAAAKFLQESEHAIWERTKGLSALAAEMLQNNEAAFERESRLRGLEPEELAIEAAKNQITANGRAQLAEIARRTGQTLPEVIIAAAEERGFKKEAPATSTSSAQRRVQQSIDRSRGESLSTMAPGQSSQPRTITSKEQLDEFLQVADPEERARFIHERDQEDPDWFSKIFAPPGR